MNIKDKFKQLGKKAVTRVKQEHPFPNSKHVIKPSFELGGLTYYEFDTLANLPWKRGLKFLSIYNELDMKCDKHYLTKHVEAMKNILSGKGIGFNELVKINALNEQLSERLKMVYQEDLIYKVASVVFFDANENPDDWEWKYALEKIERWKKKAGIHDFFLQMPMQKLMPFLSVSGLNLEEYSAIAKEIDKKHLANIYMNLSEAQKTVFSTPTQRYFSEEMKPDSQN